MIQNIPATLFLISATFFLFAIFAKSEGMVWASVVLSVFGWTCLLATLWIF